MCHQKPETHDRKWLLAKMADFPFVDIMVLFNDTISTQAIDGIHCKNTPDSMLHVQHDGIEL